MAIADKACFHCGEDCSNKNITLESKQFCCFGCRLIYQMLKEHQLDSYYKLGNNPGTAIAQSGDSDKYAYLDIPDAKEELLDFSINGLQRITFVIPAIHCSACIYLLENLPRIHSGIKTSIVDFLKKQASISFYDSELSLRKLVELLFKIGYTPDLSQKKDDRSRKGVTDKKLIFNIGLSGFCFGNIMMLSFPEYLTSNGMFIEDYQTFFGYFNLALAIPVLLFSAKNYFISAIVSLKQNRLSIDVPVVLGIVALFSRSTYEILTNSGAGYMDSFTGLVFFLLVGKWYQGKTFQSISFERDYNSYFPVAVTKMSGSDKEQVMVQSLKKGDFIQVRHNEVIPSDSILKSSEAIIDYSFVSGESNYIKKTKGEKIFAGGRQMGESILLEVHKKVNQSYFTQLWNKDVFDHKKTAIFSKYVDFISRYFTIAVLFIAFATAVYWLQFNFTTSVMTFSSVLIIACPCALALAAPFAFGNMLRIFGRKGFYLKNAMVVEQIADITDIVFDKTGTLTTANAHEIIFEGAPLSDDVLSAIKSLSQHSTHPLSQMLYNYIITDQVSVVKGFEEMKGKGISGWINGKFLLLGSANYTGIPETENKSPASRVYVNYDYKNYGCFQIKNQYRRGLELLFRNLSKDFDLHLLTGDNNNEKHYLDRLFNNDNIYFRQEPEDKLNYVKKLRDKGRRVLMVGDGLNDAGALKMADTGLAIVNDIHSFSPASDAVLDAKLLPELYSYIQLSLKSLKIVKASFILSLIYNSAGLYFAVQGILTPLIAAVLMPLSSVSVVLFVTLSTNYIATNYRVPVNKKIKVI
jgi:P-type Cu+ transporter